VRCIPFLFPENMISVELSEGREAIETLAGEWDLLVGDSFTAAFSRPHLYLAWLDVFRLSRVVVVTARENGRLAGVLPMARFRTDARGLYFTLVAPLARGDYQPPIVDPAVAQEALPAMLDCTFRRLGRRGVCWWPNIPVTDPSLGLLREFFASRRMPVMEEREIAPRIRIDGASYADVERSWTTKHRTDVRRRRKLLEAKGHVSLWQPATLAEAEPVLEEFFRVHDERWLTRGLPGMFQDPDQRRYFRALLKRLWGRGLHFSTVRCGSLDVSYHFGFFAGGWVQWYRPSYRIGYSEFSPGKLHIALVIEQACQSRWDGVDLLLGGEPHKDLWANDSMEVVSLHAGFHRWAPSYFWFSRGKPYVRSKFQMVWFRARAWLQKRRRTP